MSFCQWTVSVGERAVCHLKASATPFGVPLRVAMFLVAKLRKKAVGRLSFFTKMYSFFNKMHFLE